MIFTGFHPNIYKKDVSIALSFLLLPWKWFSIKNGKNVIEVEKWLQNYFGSKYAITFDSGRTSLQKALEAIEVQPDDEVLVQAYTCMVVSNAISWSGAKPIYVDVNNDFNMNCIDLEKKITTKSKVLIIQHTFGKAADLPKLLEIAKKNNLIVIEDCAHSFGARFQNKLLGTFGDVAMFSFGSDKIISSSRGGALITNNTKLAEKIISLNKSLPEPKLIKTKQNLINFPIFYIGKKLYDIKIGKFILALAKKINLSAKIMYKQEKEGRRVSFYPTKYANSLAKILLHQFSKVEEINKHRQEIAKIYDELLQNEKIIKPNIKDDNIFLRYTILVDEPKKLLQIAKENKIILGNWYDTVIAPKDIDILMSGYILGSCPNAEKLSKKTLNLPTNKDISFVQAKKIAELINKNV
ncbi:MAG: aminotransferase class I/II-fold pyridoxal phosphate-dependent enzyme [Candidatus Magasanikbacteria bacterium]